VTGTLLGGLAGAIIGHNDGRHGWEGAAYGAGAGLILGSLWDRADRGRETRYERVREARPVYVEVAPAPVAQAVPSQVTINNYYYGGASAAPAGGANALFGR
jgi:uncharacterized protein YcfJ